MQNVSLLAIAAALFVASRAAAAPDPHLLNAVDAELDRSMKRLKGVERNLYFIAYRINDVDSVYVAAEQGAVTYRGTRDRTRTLDVEVRIAGFAHSNGHASNGWGSFGTLFVNAEETRPLEEPRSVSVPSVLIREATLERAAEEWEKPLFLAHPFLEAKKAK